LSRESKGEVTVTVLGLSQRRAAVLISSLRGVAPGKFSFNTCARPLGEIVYDDISGTRVLLFAERGRESDALTAVRTLRSEEFYWGPIHLCADKDFEVSYLPALWGVYIHHSPPDIRNLSKALISGGDYGLRQRAEVVRNAVHLLSEDLLSLRRSLAGERRVSGERLKESFAATHDLLAANSEKEIYQRLKGALGALLSRGWREEHELTSVIPLVLAAEQEARDHGGDNALISALHSLNNVLRLSTYGIDEPVSLARRVLERALKVVERGLPELLPDEQPEVGLALEGVVSALLGFVNRGPNDDTQAALMAAAEKLNDKALRLPAFPAAAAPRAQVQRIVIVEDDDDWRGEICSILAGMHGLEEIKVQTASSLGAAQKLLRDARPALALIDLGLPLTEGSELIPDAGLVLIKSLAASDKQGRRYSHRFIILTAAESYSSAVRSAVSYGVAPSCYLQKGSASWESDLRAKVRLLVTSAPQLPSIQVFKRTGRLARVQGLEVKLDYPEWSVLAVLADSRRGAWNDPRKIANLLYWNYSLNPDARNKETETLGPEQRILLQLPHYTSDLRKKLTETYVAATGHTPAEDLISFDEEIGYRLNAAARVLDQVEEHFHRGRAPSVLVVEDNPEWGEAILTELSARGFKVRLARWLGEAADFIADEEPDLVSLDMELPLTRADWEEARARAENTVQFLDRLRSHCGDVPVAVLTAIPWRDDVMLEMLRRRVRVDDYLSKHGGNPTRALASSLHRLWQEALTDSRILDWDPDLPVHPVRIDPKSGVLSEVAGHPIKVSGGGREVLRVLSRTPNTFVSRSEILDALYGASDPEDEPADPDGALNAHLQRVRDAIKKATFGTVRGDEVICGDRGVYWLRGLVQ
jgi:DNA-binding response OmpR family regulator